MPFTLQIDQQNGFPIITLKDNKNSTEAEIYVFGGLLNAFRIPVKGQLQNIVEGFSGREDVIEHITFGFKSAKLSPFVCRMFEGKYSLNEKHYQVNKHYLHQHAIHGLIYDASYQITESQADDQHASVKLAYTYPGDDKGYPFPYHISINWKLETGNKLSVTTTIENKNAHAIPMADGWHPYFMLGGSVDEQTIQFSSITQLEYDAALLPTGKTFEDKRFINGSSLQGIQLDNSFILDHEEGTPACVLQNQQLKLTVMPDKAYPILQLYIPDHRKSIAIENLSGAPDNFNNGIGLILLEPNETRSFTTCYQAEEIL